MFKSIFYLKGCYYDKESSNYYGSFLPFLNYILKH